MNKEIIVVNEDGADLRRDVVTRETAANDVEPFAGTGALRGEYEAMLVTSGGCSMNPETAVTVYLPPRRRAA